LANIKNQNERIIQEAISAAEYSYAPYSCFRVGAALLSSNGSIFKGTNVENRSFGLTVCAERSALFSAISAGELDFIAIAIYSPDSSDPLPPCGACRQVLSEFVRDNFKVIMVGKETIIEKTIAELLPFDSLHDLKNAGDDPSLSGMHESDK
jgi:cytidine deaminase